MPETEGERGVCVLCVFWHWMGNLDIICLCGFGEVFLASNSRPGRGKRGKRTLVYMLLKWRYVTGAGRPLLLLIPPHVPHWNNRKNLSPPKTLRRNKFYLLNASIHFSPSLLVALTEATANKQHADLLQLIRQDIVLPADKGQAPLLCFRPKSQGFNSPVSRSRV